MAARMFYDKDCSLEPLAGKTIVFIGYGNQGRAQALNLVGPPKNLVPRYNADATSSVILANRLLCHRPRKLRLLIPRIPMRRTRKKMALDTHQSGLLLLPRQMYSSFLSLIR